MREFIYQAARDRWLAGVPRVTVWAHRIPIRYFWPGHPPYFLADITFDQKLTPWWRPVSAIGRMHGEDLR